MERRNERDRLNVHILQHVPFEDIGSMRDWLETRNARISYTRFYESGELPSLNNLDLVIAMGGPMSVNDESGLPWLKDEKQFIREVIAHRIPIVGVCLGAQLIANALGSRVYRNRLKEIGWFDIEAAPGSHEAFRFPQRTTVFHWHGETFDPPPGAIQLARSAGCEHQAFQVGTNAIGLQFHLETTPESLDLLITHCGEELIEDSFVQTEAELRSTRKAAYDGIHIIMNDILTYVTRSY